MNRNLNHLDRRVYIISRYGTNNQGGAERVVRLVLDDLVRHEYEVMLIDEERVMPRWLRNSRWSQFVFPILASLWLRRRHKNSEHFLTISNSSYTPFYPADVLIVHGSAAGYVRALSVTGKRFLGMRLLSRLEALSMRAAHKNACVSEYVRDLAIELYDIAPEKCSVIHNGIDTSIFRTTPKFVGQIVRLGFAGRLEYGKGLPYIIHIANWIATQPNLRLVIAIIGQIPESLQGLRNVTILRDVSPIRMSEFYDQIDIFLLPSLFEGFELVTLEAIASGVCVVGTRVGACRAFLDRGIPWVRRLPDTPHEFIGCIPKIIKELRETNDPPAMRAFIDGSFSTERFCTEIRALMLSDSK